MPACAHCVTDEDLIALGAHPVRDLPPDLLDRYARKAMSTWGEVDDFKRFLPRILELSAVQHHPTPPIIVLTKLWRADWRTWPAGEQRAVWQFLRGWWHDTLTQWSGPGRSAWRLLGAFAAAETDLSPYLSDWHHVLAGETAGRSAAVRQLVDLLCDSPLQPDRPHTVAALAPDACGDATAQIEAFLASPDTSEELERALADFAHSEHVRQIAVAFARLRRLTAAMEAGDGQTLNPGQQARDRDTALSSPSD